MKYTPTDFSTSADKEKFEKQFKKLVESGFKRSMFPKWFYTRLSMCFGHIAHYNQEGFYQTWFIDTRWQYEFLEATVKYPCYGDPAYTYSDVEKVLVAWIEEKKFLHIYGGKLIEEIEAQEVKELARLKNKYPFVVV